MFNQFFFSSIFFENPSDHDQDDYILLAVCCVMFFLRLGKQSGRWKDVIDVN
jgi:hypothetical protein